MPEQTARQFRSEQHRNFTRRYRTRTQAAGRALCRTTANALRVRQQLALATHVVPVVALHLPFALGDHYAAQAVARRGRAANKAVAVAIHAAPLMGVERGAIGILDPAVGIERRRFTDQGTLNGLLRGDIPRVEQIEVWLFFSHQRSVGETGAFIFGGVFGNRQRSRYGFANGVSAAGGGTGRAFALTDIQGDTKALVAVELDGFHFTLANRGRQALLQGHRHFTGACALTLGFGDDLLNLFLQCRQGLRAYALSCTHDFLHQILLSAQAEYRPGRTSGP